MLFFPTLNIEVFVIFALLRTLRDLWVLPSDTHPGWKALDPGEILRGELIYRVQKKLFLAVFSRGAEET